MSNDDKAKLNVRFLPKGVQNPQFEQRESGVAHTPYSREVAFYTCIKNGDLEGLKSNMASFMSEALIVGRMSDDNLRQVKYLAVSCITLATRYAVEGGLMESEAYNLSDAYIQTVDKTDSPEEIMNFLIEKAVELTMLVKSHRQRLEYPPYIRKAIKVVNARLHERLTCDDVASECGVSADYLSQKFKKYVGVSLHKYIVTQKLEESKTLLVNGVEYGGIGYYFGFCSQTHYIQCFKKEYGMTPKEYIAVNATV